MLRIAKKPPSFATIANEITLNRRKFPLMKHIKYYYILTVLALFTVTGCATRPTAARTPSTPLVCLNRSSIPEIPRSADVGWTLKLPSDNP